MYRNAAAIVLALTLAAAVAMLALAGYRMARASATCRRLSAVALELEPAMAAMPGPPVEEPAKQKETCRRVIAAWENVPEGRDFSPAILSQ